MLFAFNAPYKDIVDEPSSKRRKAHGGGGAKGVGSGEGEEATADISKGADWIDQALNFAGSGEASGDGEPTAQELEERRREEVKLI